MLPASIRSATMPITRSCWRRSAARCGAGSTTIPCVTRDCRMYSQLQLRDAARPPVNLTTLNRMREEGEPIAALTCYDASYAVLVDQAGVDLVLVGDSLGMVIQGHDTTVPVTVDDMIYHTRAVARGTYRPFLVADLPF